MPEDDLCVRPWIEIIWNCIISKTGHLCPTMHRRIKNVKQYMTSTKGEVKRMYNCTQLTKIFLFTGTWVMLKKGPGKLQMS